MQGMKTVTVLDRQSIFDIAIQHCGAAEAACDIALLNGISITDELPANSVVKMPSIHDNTIVDYYLQNNIIPATK